MARASRSFSSLLALLLVALGAVEGRRAGAFLGDSGSFCMSQGSNTSGNNRRLLCAGGAAGGGYVAAPPTPPTMSCEHAQFLKYRKCCAKQFAVNDERDSAGDYHARCTCTRARHLDAEHYWDSARAGCKKFGTYDAPSPCLAACVNAGGFPRRCGYKCARRRRTRV